MGNPRIVYDTKNLDFPEALTGLQVLRRTLGALGSSASSVLEGIVNEKWDEVAVELATFPDKAFARDLVAWWSWASEKNLYSFAMDRDLVGDTTLDGAAAAGQKVVPVTATTGFTAGASEEVRIRLADGTLEEIGVIDTLVAGVSLTMVDNLKFTYASGDLCRHKEFWPKVRSLDLDQPWQENPGLTYTVAHRFREDRA